MYNSPYEASTQYTEKLIIQKKIDEVRSYWTVTPSTLYYPSVSFRPQPDFLLELTTLIFSHLPVKKSMTDLDSYKL